MDRAQELLNQYFGYQNFKSGQAKLISQIAAGRDVLAIMPTGAGKSLCYQIPALMASGVTLVISPLISLMKDQVDALSSLGIPAAFINSSVDRETQNMRMLDVFYGRCKILYVAPERLFEPLFLRLVQKIEISLVAVDEAHCVSAWGHDFRPSYLDIAKFLSLLPKRPPVAALTATATPRVQDDIISLLGLQNPFVQVTGFDRENLYFGVAQPHDKFAWLLSFLQKHAGECGIVFCATRKTCEQVCQKLCEHGISAGMYHAGMPENHRKAAQDAFLYDKFRVMAATNAFGMGIDKSNINFVVHYNMPKNLESYYQEAGRAGRDGSPASCILLFSPQDVVTGRYFIENGEDAENKEASYQKLRQMTDYCHTSRCLRSYILEYFGEAPLSAPCQNCENCLSAFSETDVTKSAMAAFMAVAQTGGRFGAAVICDVLKGSDTAKMRQGRFGSLSSFGALKEHTKPEIKELLAFLTAEGYFVAAGDAFPVLKLTQKAFAAKEESQRIFMRKKVLQKPEGSVKGAKNGALFEALRNLRKQLAAAEGVPPYVVFSDKTLLDMCDKAPQSTDELLAVSGVGAFKAEKYGRAFLEEIGRFLPPFSTA